MKKAICLLMILIICTSQMMSCQDIYYNGIDRYIERKGREDDLCEVSHFLYSYEFVEKFEYINGDYHYLETHDEFATIEKAIMYLTYTPEVYNLAKKDIFRNTDFLSETPQYVYNDYEFYRLNFHAEFDSWYTMNAFNDAKNTIVMFGFFGDVKLNGEKIGELPVQSEWRDYLKTHFGEFYDFDL